MNWLSHLGVGASESIDFEEREEPKPARLRRGAPALALVFEGLDRDRNHAVLDLGPATKGHLLLYQRYALRIGFAGLLPCPPPGPAFGSALAELPRYPGHPYDVVVAWNLLDFLPEDQRRFLIDRLTAITAPDAALYAVVDASDARVAQPVLSIPLDLDRVATQAVGRPRPTGPPLLPSDVERLLLPFQVRRAFALRGGLREYAAAKDRPNASVENAAGTPPPA